MNRFYSLALFSVFLLAVSSCKKDDDKPAVAPTGKVQVSFRNFVGGAALATGPVSYTNANGDRYSVDLLKYYVSHFTLIRDDSTEIVSKGHELIDQADSASMQFSLDSIPNGRYIGARFYLGVDYNHNHSGDQSGDLDPINGMIWTWNTGYIFFKHEGTFRDAANNPRPLFFHLGTDPALAEIRVPVAAFEVAGNSRRLTMRFDLNKVYAGPPMIDFSVDNNRMSTSRDDAFWIGQMSGNMTNAFSAGAVE